MEPVIFLFNCDITGVRRTNYIQLNCVYFWCKKRFFSCALLWFHGNKISTRSWKTLSFPVQICDSSVLKSTMPRALQDHFSEIHTRAFRNMVQQSSQYWKFIINQNHKCQITVDMTSLCIFSFCNSQIVSLRVIHYWLFPPTKMENPLINKSKSARFYLGKNWSFTNSDCPGKWKCNKVLRLPPL